MHKDPSTPLSQAPLGLCNRRELLSAGAALALGAALPASVTAATPRTGNFDFARVEDHLQAWLKIYGDLAGNIDTYSWFGGEIFAVTGERQPPVALLGWEGFAVNRIVPQDDGSFRVFINECAFYKDRDSDRIIDRWRNPFTGEDCEVWQLHAGPLTNRLTTVRRHQRKDGSFEETPFRLPLYVQGDDAFVSIEFNDVRDNALQPDAWPRESSGAKVRVAESMQFMTRLADLQNPALTRCDTTVAWTLLRGWLPWMLMGQAPGHLFFRSVIQKLAGPHQLPPRLVTEAERRFPASLRSPPDAAFGNFDTSDKVFQRERRPVPLRPARGGS
jgi:hypothetical protein